MMLSLHVAVYIPQLYFMQPFNIYMKYDLMFSVNQPIFTILELTGSKLSTIDNALFKQEV